MSPPTSAPLASGPESQPVMAQSIDEKAASHHPPRSTLKNLILIGTVTLAQILSISNVSVAAISLPTIGRELDITESKLQWLVSAFSLSSGCLLLFLGRAADLYGRKKAFILGCAFMGIFGLGCGFAQNEITIDVLRGLQGIGPAAAIPAALGILAHTFPPSHLRSIAFATFAAGAPIGGAVGNIIGGVFTQVTKESWRSAFWFMTGLSFLCCVGAWISIDPDEPYQLEDKRLDWIGAFLITAGLTLIIFVLSDGSMAPNGWKTGYIIALLIVGVLLVGAFVLWERYLEQVHTDANATRDKWWTPPPLMPVSIWARGHGKFAAVLAIAFVEWCSFNVFTFWVQLYYQDYLGLDPILTMVRLLPMFVTGVTCNVIIALVVSHVPLVVLAMIGTLLTGVSSLLFALIDPAAPYWAFGFPAAILTVVGADFVFATGTLFTAKVCLPHEQSLGGALFQTLTQIGTAFGLAISTVVFNQTMGREASKFGVGVDGVVPPAGQLVAYKDTMWVGFAFGAFGAALAFVGLRGVGVVGHRKDAPPDDAPRGTESEVTANEEKDQEKAS